MHNMYNFINLFIWVRFELLCAKTTCLKSSGASIGHRTKFSDFNKSLTN